MRIAYYTTVVQVIKNIHDLEKKGEVEHAHTITLEPNFLLSGKCAFSGRHIFAHHGLLYNFFTQKPTHQTKDINSLMNSAHSFKKVVLE